MNSFILFNNKNTVISALKSAIKFTTLSLIFFTTSCDFSFHKDIFPDKFNSVSNIQFNPIPGTYNSNQNVELTCLTAGAVIYYTTDGSTPTTSSSIYSTTIPVTGSGTVMTINAIAVKSGSEDSSVATGQYIIDYDNVSAPVMSLAGGIYNSDIPVTLTSSTSGATIYYTTDGSTPTTSSSVYSSAISVADNGTDCIINAYAVYTGMDDSSVSSATYQIRYVLYATLGNYAYISKDAGASWLPPSNLVETIYSIYAFGNDIYAGGSIYVYYSTDGSTWVTRTLNSLSQYVYGLSADSTYLYASTYNYGLQYSDDKGVNFLPTLTIVNQRAIYVQGGIIYLATNAGLYYSLSTSSPFTLSHAGSPITTMGSTDLYDVYVSGTDIYVAANGGVSVSADSGNTWTDYTTSDGLANSQVNGICSDGTLIYAATASGLSIYDGSSWSTDSTIGPLQCNRVRINGSVVYVATNSGLYISYDSGATWQVYYGSNIIRDVCVAAQ